MQIRIKADGRMLQGTALQIVREMQGLAFGKEHLPLVEYIDWSVAQAARMERIELKVEGTTDEQRARSFIGEMIRAGLAEKVG